MDELNLKNLSELRKNFASPKAETRPYTFITLDFDITDEAAVETRISNAKKHGFGGIVLCPTHETVPEYLTPEYFTEIKNIARRAAEAELDIVIADDCATDSRSPSGYAGGKFAKLHPDLCAMRLDREEYKCDEHEKVCRKVKEDGVLMSCVAYDEDTSETLFLLPYVTDGTLNYEMPDGNWVISFFYCRSSDKVRHVNYLDYDASFEYVKMAYSGIAEVAGMLGDNHRLTCFYDCVQFITENRRDWHVDFNREFINRYGFDPAPHYLSLFIDVNDSSAYYRGLLLHFRSEMIRKGFFKAVSDYAHSRGMMEGGSVAIPKSVSAPWIYGDGIRFQEKSDFAYCKSTNAYLYSLNSIKIASSAAYNYGKRTTVCDIFREFTVSDSDFLYNEAMSVFARGVNQLWVRDKVHTEGFGLPEMLPDFCEYSARCRTLLSDGRHCADIAMIYPISSLEAQTYLFEHPLSGGQYEYPVIPDNADFMNLINTLMDYCGHDVTVLHPAVLNSNCFVEDGYLRLGRISNPESFRVLILPGASTLSIDIMRTVAKFYDQGGKIIATSCLPFTALERHRNPDTDGELAALIKHVFGVEKDSRTLTDYYVQHNEKGGIAYFLHSSETAADGSVSVSPRLLEQVLDDFGIDWDITVGNMPKAVEKGIFNLYYPQYKNLSYESKSAAGGVFNVIHRKFADADIFFLSNPTNNAYKGRITLRGALNVEEWNPYTGKTRKMNTVRTKNDPSVSTVFESYIPSRSSIFYVGTACAPKENGSDKSDTGKKSVIENIGLIENLNNILNK